MRRDDDPIGVEGRQRVRDRLHGIGVSDPAGCVDSGALEAAEDGLESLLCRTARAVVVGEPVA